MPSLKSLTYLLPYIAFFAYDTFLCCNLWPLTFDLEHLQCIACSDVMKLCTKFERNRAIPRRSYCDLNIWPNDLERRVTCCARLLDNFTKFDLRHLIRAWIIAFFDAKTLSRCDLDLWPTDLRQWVKASRDQSLYEIWAKSSNPRLN